MGLYQLLLDDLKQAMKTGDVLKRDTLRLLQSAIKNVAIEKRVAPTELSESDVEAVMRRLVKQRHDSIASYEAGHRPDLAKKEASELALLTPYLPASMSETELRSLVVAVLKENDWHTKDVMGQAMGGVMKRVAGRAPGDEVRKIVVSLLT